MSKSWVCCRYVSLEWSIFLGGVYNWYEWFSLELNFFNMLHFETNAYISSFLFLFTSVVRLAPVWHVSSSISFVNLSSFLMSRSTKLIFLGLVLNGWYLPLWAWIQTPITAYCLTLSDLSLNVLVPLLRWKYSFGLLSE